MAGKTVIPKRYIKKHSMASKANKITFFRSGILPIIIKAINETISTNNDCLLSHKNTTINCKAIASHFILGFFIRQK